MSAKVQEEYSQDDASTGSYGSHTSSNSNSKLGGLSNSLNSTDSNKNVNIRETTKMLQKDIWVRRIRVITIFVFLVAAITISMVVYISLKDSERREFEQRFADQSAHVRRSVHAELASKFSAIDALATTLTSYAGSRSGGWPNITLPEFSYRATSTLNIGRGISVGVQPIVYKHKLNEWEEFSVGTQGWRRDGLDFQTMFPNALDPSEHTHYHDYRKLMFIDIVQNISSRIFSVDDGVPTMVDNDIMMPVWQHTPVHQMLPWVNYDVFSRNDNRPALTEVMNNQNAVLGLYFELSESSHG
jgi:superoxide dismutase